MTAIEKLIAIADNEIGYMEKKSSADLDDKTENAGDGNFTKYARDMDAINGFFNSRKQGVAWCSVFVSWCFVQAFGAENGRKLLCQPKKSAGAGCKSAMSYYRNKGRLYDYPEKGDQVFFCGSGGEATHTGIVIDAAGNRITTIEGNTSAGSAVAENGGMVCRKQYDKGNGRIAGYGRPDWNITEVEDNDMEEMRYRAKVTITDGKTVNLRKSPSTAAPVLYRVPGDAEVQVTGHENETWAQVFYSGGGVTVSGYIKREFLQSVEQGIGEDGMLTLRIEKETAKKILDAISAAME